MQSEYVVMRTDRDVLAAIWSRMKTALQIVRSPEEQLIVQLAASDIPAAQQLVETSRIDIARIIELSSRHMMTAIVFQRLAQLTLEEPLRSHVMTIARRTTIDAIAFGVTVRSELHRVADLLARAGIDMLVIKGPAVDKDPLRWANDLDVLVSQRDVMRAVGVLTTAGYKYIGSPILDDREKCRLERQLEWNNQFQFASPASGLQVEIHYNLFERDRIRLERLDRFLDSVALFGDSRRWDNELGCHIPAPESSLALLCVHAATKRSPASGAFVLRHAYDIVGLVQKGIEEERFLSLCHAWAIEYYAYASLRLAALCLEARSSFLLASRLKPSLTARMIRLADIQCRCFRGLDSSSSFYRRLYVLYMPSAIGGGWKKSIRWYREAIFAPRWRQEARTGVSRDSPRIYLTYVTHPLERIYRAIERILRPRPSTGR